MADAPYDYVIVGAGSAGCALAYRLTESGRHRVLLLEAGGVDRNLWIRVPLGVAKTIQDERLVWKFATEPEPGLAGQSLYWPRGRVLGGSSSVNGMVYVRGDPREYDRWRELGNDDWSYRELLPVFKRMERYAEGDPAYRGHDGPLAVTNRRTKDPDPLSEAYVEACRQSGMPVVDDYNAADWEGASMLQLNTRRGLRCSTANAYLRPARKRANLALLTDAHVLRVLFEGRRAVGVEYQRGGATALARAAREVILCAGSVQSPQLLELSGVGDAARLQGLGIPVVHHLPGVGEGLIDHLQVRLTFECTRPITINDLMRSPWRRLLVGMRFVFLRKGIMTATSSTAHAICRTRPELARPDVKVQLYQISGKDRYARTASLGIDPYSGFSIGGFKIHPESRGSVHARSVDPFAPPEIRANYLTHPEDQRTCVDMLRLVRRIASQPAMKPFIVAERRPGPEVGDDAGLLAFAKETGQTSWHPIRTCRMGNDAQAVVDARLRVRGLEGLRVADASIMPTMASSNSNAPAIMIGERCADYLLEEKS